MAVFQNVKLFLYVKEVELRLENWMIVLQYKIKQILIQDIIRVLK